MALASKLFDLYAFTRQSNLMSLNSMDDVKKLALSEIPITYVHKRKMSSDDLKVNMKRSASVFKYLLVEASVPSPVTS